MGYNTKFTIYVNLIPEGQDKERVKYLEELKLKTDEDGGQLGLTGAIRKLIDKAMGQ